MYFRFVIKSKVILSWIFTRKDKKQKTSSVPRQKTEETTAKMAKNEKQA